MRVLVLFGRENHNDWVAPLFPVAPSPGLLCVLVATDGQNYDPFSEDFPSSTYVWDEHRSIGLVSFSGSEISTKVPGYPWWCVSSFQGVGAKVLSWLPYVSGSARRAPPSIQLSTIAASMSFTVWGTVVLESKRPSVSFLR